MTNIAYLTSTGLVGKSDSATVYNERYFLVDISNRLTMLDRSSCEALSTHLSLVSLRLREVVLVSYIKSHRRRKVYAIRRKSITANGKLRLYIAS